MPADQGHIQYGNTGCFVISNASSPVQLFNSQTA